MVEGPDPNIHLAFQTNHRVILAIVENTMSLYASQDRLTRGYATLALLERECHQSHFQEPRTKGWLFDTLVTPAAMYASPIWAPGLSSADWQRIKRPLILMLSLMIYSKPSVPHPIIRAEFAASPMVVEALFQTITFIQHIRDMDPNRLPRRAFESSQRIASQGGHPDSDFLARGPWDRQLIPLLVWSSLPLHPTLTGRQEPDPKS